MHCRCPLRGRLDVIDEGPPGLPAGRPAAGPQEVRRIGAPLEADQVGAEEPLDDLPAPRQLREQLIAGERDVAEEPDPQIRSGSTQHRRHQLQLVVVHPHRGARSRLRGGHLREPLVDRHIGVPPGPVELRGGDDVVIERPQRGIAEAFVDVLDLSRRQRHRDQGHAIAVERLRGATSRPRPADPHPVGALHHRSQSTDQTPRAGPPGHRSAREIDAVDGQPVGHDHQVVPAGWCLCGAHLIGGVELVARTRSTPS